MYHAVILCGGSGTRLWPLTRHARPKQFLKLIVDQSLLRETVDRVARTVPSERIWIVTGRAHAAEARAILPELPDDNIIVEPTARNSAGAVGLAASRLFRRDPDATMTAFPADHLMTNHDQFDAALRLSSSLAESGSTVYIGVTPTYPETGYGYIKRGAVIESRGGVTAFEASAFVEKPDRERATEFVRSGVYLWNAGIFSWRVDALRALFERHIAGSLDMLDRAESLLESDPDVAQAAFSALPNKSIDYAVLEKAPDRKVVEADLGWLDIGNWDAIYGASPRDARGNALLDGTIAIDVDSTLVAGNSGRTIALVGVSDLVVVDTPDALLVCRRERHQDVRAVVEELRRRGLDRLL
ncbi:MAG: mannose-1-phosphate guanyltransferase [Chloroflexota bacterium]|nr:MAG: mannose-1-phosphate guanyltransferase [Chloroflexota bacterium]